MKQDVKSESPRQPLDRRRIAQTALTLIDELGIEQLSMRRLGAALGVEAMALYHYFHNKAELVAGIKDHLLDQLEAQVPANSMPLDRVRSTFVALRRIAIDHPDLFPSMGSATFVSERALAYYERLMNSMFEAGLNAEQSARYFRLLSNFTVGAGIAEVGRRAEDGANGRSIEGREASYPKVLQVAPHLEEAGKLEAIFGFGLDLIFASLRAELSGQPPIRRQD